MRLTEKIENFYATVSQDTASPCIQKLGQLEDILEKYNIDTNEELETLCKYAESVREWMSIYKEKMFEIRKIERELGIDLIILFKALKNGIYVKNIGVGNNNWNEHIITKVKVPCLKLDYQNHKILRFEQKRKYCFDVYDLKDYGKTWALDKNDLTSE